jgi:stearoyl-CoA desaturase (delta-9 desaturase)
MKFKMKTTYKLIINHAMCHLALIPAFLYGEWWMFALSFLWYYFITIASSSAGYHRFYSHKTFKAGKWFEIMTNTLSLFVGSGPYLTRAAIHRQHHAYADTEKDPSSPQHNGFWRIYFNLWGLEHNIEKRFFKGLIDNPVLLFFHNHYFKLAGLLVVSLLLIDPMLFIFAYAIPCILSSHLFGLFNAYLHKDGAAANSAWVNLFTAGEGYHETHHSNPRLKKQGPFDPTYWFICLIENK